MIDRELANEAARNQLRAQLPDLTEAQVRHKGKMIAGAVLSTVQAPSREATKDLIARAVAEGREKFRDMASQWTEEQAREAFVGEIFTALDESPDAVSRDLLASAFSDAVILLDESGVYDEGQANDFLADAVVRLLYGVTGQAAAGHVDRDLIAGLIPLGFDDRDPYANVYEAADTIISALPRTVLDRDALAAHLASVRWDNAATRMDRQKFWNQRADEAIAAAGARSEAEVKAEGLREAAAEMRRILVGKRKTLGGPADEWLLARADQLS